MNKWQCIKIFISACFCCVILVLLMRTSQPLTAVLMMRRLCDASFVVGLVFLSMGLYLIIRKHGFFDIFGYASHYFFSVMMPLKRSLYRDYYEYKKTTVRNKTNNHYIVVGVFFLLLSVAFLVAESQLIMR